MTRWVVLVLFLSPPIGLVAQSVEPAAAELFRAYQQRQFDQFASQLTGIRDFGALRKQIAREGKDWPLEAKAAFLLETADAALQHKELTVRTGPEVDLFEDACKAVRQLPPQGQFEAAWHAAALSVLAARYGAAISVDEHLKHIRGRFDEGRMALVRAMPGERISWHDATQVVQPTFNGPDPTEGFLPSPRRMGRANMRDVVKILEAGRKHDSARPEATLRQAVLFSIWQQHDEALPLLAIVESLTNDPWLRYMAALMSGRSLEAVGRRGDAQAAYRSAVNLQPNGKAARLALASMVFAAGGREEADRLVGEVLSATSSSPDPWKEFFGGEFRFLEVRRTAMREQIK